MSDQGDRMPRLPVGAMPYQETKVFTAESTPKGLLRSHTTKADAWAQIVVETGEVKYVLEDEDDLAFVLTPDRPGVVAPQRPHHVAPQPGARFFVRFLRAPD